MLGPEHASHSLNCTKTTQQCPFTAISTVKRKLYAGVRGCQCTLGAIASQEALDKLHCLCVIDAAKQESHGNKKSNEAPPQGLLIVCKLNDKWHLKGFLQVLREHEGY